MTGGSPQTDPRADDEFRPWDAALLSDAAVVAAVKALLNGPGEWIGDGLQIAQLGQQIVRAVHAADEASGVRRVTAQELADNLDLARQEARKAALEEAAALYDQRADAVERLEATIGRSYSRVTASQAHRAVAGTLRSLARRSSSAADSPVGGVS